MSIYQEHFGRKFSQCKKTGYWLSTSYTKTQPRIRAHSWVWQNHYGKPPKGYHIHHINEDKSDNRIENLELMKGFRHLGYHMVKRMISPEYKQKCQKQMETIRPLTKEWHRSEEGRAWHTFHALRHKFGKGKPQEYECSQCAKKFISSKLSNTRFCSNACKSKYRRENKIDHIKKVCLICKNEFLINKYAKTITCSRKCGGIYKSSVVK